MLIELFVKLLILPFKVLWEILELLAHANHRSHRRHRPAPARRAGGSNSNAGCLVLLGMVGVGLLVALVVGVVRNPSTLLTLLVVAALLGGVVWLCAWLGHRGQPRTVQPMRAKVAGDICNTGGLDPTFFHGVGVGHLCQLPWPHDRHVCRCGGSWSDTDPPYVPTDG